MKVYVDGELKETVEASTPPEEDWAGTPVKSKLYLGRCNHPKRYGRFYIDEWYYWNNLLSDKSIRKVYALDK